MSGASASFARGARANPGLAGSLGLLAFLAWHGLGESRAALVMLVLAVAAGEAFQIPNTANIAGYDAELLAQGVSEGFGDVRLRPRSGPRFVDAARVAARAAAVPGVRAVLPVLTLPGAVLASGRSLPAAILGIDAGAPRVPYRLAEGRALPPGALGALLLGGQLATRLAVAPGARVDLRVILELGRAGGQERLPLSASASPASPAPPGPRALGAYAMEVAGIVRGAFTADEAVVVDRGFLSAELGEPDAATLLVVRSDAPFEAEALARRIEVALPEVEARAWAADSAFLGSAIQGNRALNAISSAMAMVGVAIPVWALLYVAVTRRRREIGLYGALGFSAREVFALFLMHALVVGLAGVALGAAAGVGLVRWFSAHPIFADASFAIRPALAPAALLRSSAIILGTTVAAGVVPALRAARVDPARVLRGLP